MGGLGLLWVGLGVFRDGLGLSFGFGLTCDCFAVWFALGLQSYTLYLDGCLFSPTRQNGDACVFCCFVVLVCFCGSLTVMQCSVEEKEMGWFGIVFGLAWIFLIVFLDDFWVSLDAS